MPSRVVREVEYWRDPESGAQHVEIRIDGEPVALPTAEEVSRIVRRPVDEKARSALLHVLAKTVSSYMDAHQLAKAEVQDGLARIEKLASELVKLLAEYPFLDRPVSACWRPLPEGLFGTREQVHEFLQTAAHAGGGEATPHEMLKRLLARVRMAKLAVARQRRPGRPWQRWTRELARGLVDWWRALGADGPGVSWNAMESKYVGPLLDLGLRLSSLARLRVSRSMLAKLLLEVHRRR